MAMGAESPEQLLEAGRRLAEAGDLAGARTAFAQAAETRHPDIAPKAALALGTLLQQDGDAQGALRAYQFAAMSDDETTSALAGMAAALLGQEVATGLDNPAEAAYEQGCQLLATGDAMGARAAFARAVDSGDPEFAPLAAARLGAHLAQHGLPAEAIQVLWIAVDSGHPEHAPAGAYVLGQLLVENDEHEAAKGVLALAAELPEPQMAGSAMATLAELLVQDEELAEALVWFARIVAAGDPELGPHAALRVGALLVDDDLHAAMTAWRYAADHAQGEVAEAAVSNLDLVAQHTGVPVRAAPATRDEVLGWAAIGRGRLLLAAGDLAGAGEAFGQAQACPHPEASVAGQAYLGSCLRLQGDSGASQGTLEAAFASGHPTYAPMAAIDLSELLLERGEISRALEVLREAQAGEGWSAALAGVNLGVLYAHRLGDPESALEQLRRSVASDNPGARAAALFNLATIVEDAGDLEAARQAYEQAVALRQPEYSGKAAVNLGILLSKQMDVKGAHAAWEIAVEVGNEDDRAKGRGLLDELARHGSLEEVHERAQSLDLADLNLVGASAVHAGRQLLSEGDLASAIRTFEKAMDTKHPIRAAEGAAQVALVFWMHEGMTGAETALGRLTEIGSPELLPRGWFFFTLLMIVGGELDDAATALQVAADLPGDARAAALCALSILGSDAAGAEQAYPAVVAETPDLASYVVLLALDLGDVLGRQEETDGSQAAYSIGHRLARQLGDDDLIAQAQKALNG
jgi:tetratricopeptide (TPR) repeat protein